MAQTDIYKILEEERKLNENWLSVNEVKAKLSKLGFSKSVIRAAPNDLFKLATFNLIEVKGVGIWKHEKHFRGKKESTSCIPSKQ